MTDWSLQGRKSRDVEIMYPASPTGIATTPDGFLLVYSDTHIDVFDAAAGEWCQTINIRKTRPLLKSGSLNLSLLQEMPHITYLSNIHKGEQKLLNTFRSLGASEEVRFPRLVIQHSPQTPSHRISQTRMLTFNEETCQFKNQIQQLAIPLIISHKNFWVICLKTALRSIRIIRWFRREGRRPYQHCRNFAQLSPSSSHPLSTLVQQTKRTHSRDFLLRPI